MMFPKNEELFFSTIGTVYLKHTTRNPLSNAVFDKQRCPNMTLHFNKEHVLFQVKRSKEQIFYLQPKKQAQQSSNRHFWNVLNVVLESFYFAQETKAILISIRYHKTSQTQDVKSKSTKPNLRKLAQPKRDSAFEQKTRFVSSREIWGSSQNNFCSYNQRKHQSRAQTHIFGTYSTRFGKLVFFFGWNRPKIFGRFVRKSSKQLQTIQNDEDHVSEKIKSCFYKYSVSQDISNAGCKEPRYRT